MESNYFIPIQSSANAEALNCLFNFTLKQAIIKNEGFYWYALATSKEIAILYVNVVYGAKGVADSITKTLNNFKKAIQEKK